MDTLKNKIFENYDYISRYSSVPYYHDTLYNRDIYGIGTNIKTDTDFLTYKLKSNDTLNSLALKFYNNPTFWWVIAYFNNIQDPFKPLRHKFKTIKIPNISSIEFGRINE
jgi:hypothetical protein